MKKILLFSLLFSSVAFAGIPPEDIRPAAVTVQVSGKNMSVFSGLNAASDFYLFDVQGNLVQHLSIKNTTESIKGLNRGTYLYTVLKQDNVIATGKVTIK